MLVMKWAQMPDETVKDAFSVREEVFVKEQGFQEEFDSMDHSSLHLICYENEIPIACARIFSEENDVWHAGRIAVKKEYRGTGMGAKVMAALEQKTRELGGKKIVLGAQCRAAEFYRKQGFQKEGGEYLEEGCPHVKMFKMV